MAYTHALDVLKNKLLSDFQRPNFFEIVFDGFDEGTAKLAQREKLELTSNMINGINYPFTTIAPIEIRRMGKVLRIPGEVSNSQEVQLTMNADVEGELRRFFSEWQKNYYISMDSPEFMHEKKFTTKISMEIFPLDGNHRRRSGTKLFNVWPKMVGEMSFSHSTDNEISTFPVTLAFSYAEYRN